jgi:predicted membrane metal-binding protein
MSELKGHVEVKMGSERSLGFVFAIVFIIVGLWPLTGDGGPRLWALAIAALFAALGLFFPKLLGPLNKVWFKFGMVLSAIVSPIVMGLLFFSTVTPTALFMRLRNKDLLKRKLDRNAESYWILRDEPVGTMKNQY